MQLTLVLPLAVLLIYTRAELALLPTDEEFYHVFEGSSLNITCANITDQPDISTVIHGNDGDSEPRPLVSGETLRLSPIHRSLTGLRIQCQVNGSDERESVASAPLAVYYLESIADEQLSVSLRPNDALDCSTAFRPSSEANMTFTYSWSRSGVSVTERSSDPVLVVSWGQPYPSRELVTCTVTARLLPNNATQEFIYIYTITWSNYYDLIYLVAGILGPLEIIAISSLIIALCVNFCRSSKRSDNSAKRSDLWLFNDMERDRGHGVGSRPIRVLPRADPTSVQLNKSSARQPDDDFPSPPPLELLECLHKTPEGAAIRLNLPDKSAGENKQGQMSIRNLRNASSRSIGSNIAAVPAKVPTLLRTPLPAEGPNDSNLPENEEDGSHNYDSIGDEDYLKYVPAPLISVDNRAYMWVDKPEQQSHIYIDTLDTGTATSSH